MRYLVGHAAKGPTGQTTLSVGSHDDQVNLLGGSHVENVLGG